MIAFYLNDEGSLVYEKIDIQILRDRLRTRQGGRMDYCLSSNVKFLYDVPEDFKDHEILILYKTNNSLMFTDTFKCKAHKTWHCTINTVYSFIVP